ncbi:hypothetical protein GCM10027059_26890 [Myceligenerans halotolerans]
MTTTIPRWLHWLVSPDPQPERATPPQPVRLPHRPVYPIVRVDLTPSEVYGLAFGGPGKAPTTGREAACGQPDCPVHGDDAPEQGPEEP